LKKIILVTTTDVLYDQRVHRSATSLHRAGYKVLVIGRRLEKTPKVVKNDYKVKLLSMYFQYGVLFYFFFNFRIFFRLLFSKFDAVFANDLDTLVGTRMVAILRFKPFIYDSHELFTEVPELLDRPLIRKIWLIAERLFIKGIKHSITVSEGVAAEYEKRYGIKMTVIRNLPLWKEIKSFKAKQPIIIYQGALNKGRGIELAIDMMKYLNCYKLIIVGSGDIELQLRKRMVEQQLFDRVEFRGRTPMDELHKLTCSAWLGLSLEEDMGLSYHNALPNKIFDYILAQVPILVTNLPEMKKVIDKYGVGLVINTRDPKDLANMIADFFEDKEARKVIASNLDVASKELIWEKEEPILLDIISNALRKKSTS